MKRVKFNTSFGRFTAGSEHEVGNRSAEYFARGGKAEILDAPSPASDKATATASQSRRATNVLRGTGGDADAS